METRPIETQPIETTPLGFASWERVIRIMDEVTDRMHRVTAALEQAGVPYALIGGNAVATWVGSIDKAAVRLTQDVDILLRRSDLDLAQSVLQAAGFIYAITLDVPMFLDNPSSSPRNAVHVVFAGERVRPHDVAPTPDVTESQAGERFRVVTLQALVNMKLTSFRRKDQVHLQDMIEVGLIDSTWPNRFTPELATRLKQILDTPDG